MSRKYRLAVIATGVAITSMTASASGAVLVNETFGAGWTPGTAWAVSGSSAPATATVPGQTPETALRLTSIDSFKAGTVSYTAPQPTTDGIDIRFNLSQWGGNYASGRQGDGISFFIRKGSDPSNAPGAGGGALGYAPIPPYSDGMSGGLLGIGFDQYGSYAGNVVNGTGCAAVPGADYSNRVAIRGPGQAKAGYCRLGVSNPGAVAFNGGADSRDGRARSIRVTIDPASVPNPRVTVYYAPNGTGTGLTEVLSIPEPAEMLAEPTFKFGFSAATGGATNNNEVWNARVGSLDPVPITITTTTLPHGTVGKPYTCTPIATSDAEGAVTFAVATGSLPRGLTLNATTGEICGTPVATGSSTFTISATDSRTPLPSSATQQYTLTIVTPAEAAAEAVRTVHSTGTPTATATAVLVDVVTTHPGEITVTGSSKTAGRWVRRCTGEAGVTASTRTTSTVRCVLTPAARRLLCKGPLRLRIVSRLVSPTLGNISTSRTVTVRQRSCGGLPVVG